MCGRYDLSESPAAIRAQFRVPDLPDFAGGPDLRPSQMLPIVRLDAHGARSGRLARWGLVPSWAPDLSFGSKCFNARSETAARSPAFRAAYRSRRCLVPMNAFFEWSGPAGQRIKHRVRPEGATLFALAGLWERWGTDENALDTFTILTCPPNAALAPIHNRMPVILDAPDYDGWLVDAQAALLRPYEGALRIVAVSNAPARRGPVAPAPVARDPAGAEAPPAPQQQLTLL